MHESDADERHPQSGNDRSAAPLRRSSATPLQEAAPPRSDGQGLRALPSQGSQGGQGDALCSDGLNSDALNSDALRPEEGLSLNGVERLASARVPTPHGEFRVFSYRSAPSLKDLRAGERAEDGAEDGHQTEHMVCVLGDPVHPADPAQPALVRIHSECATGDLLGSLRCDCGEQLQSSLRRIAKEGEGLLVYLRSHEGRGVGLARKFKAYTLQDEGADTVDANLRQGLPADGRNYALAAAILADLGIRSVRLLTNNLDKVAGLLENGVSVAERIPVQTDPNPENLRYLTTKRDRLGHLLEGLDDGASGETGNGAPQGPQGTDLGIKADDISGNLRR